MNAAISIRPTAADDHPAVIDLVRAAFSDATRDGQEEVDIVVQAWALGATVKPIDLVAVDADVVVGHVLATSGRLGADELIGVAPLAVAPSHQGRGIGSALMVELLRLADAAGWPAAVLLGAPAYYGRFGFTAAGPAGIVYSPVGADSPHFQVRRLAAYRESLQGEFIYCWEAVS